MAAGKGTRLKSQLPKVLHEVGGKPLLEHVIRAPVKIVPAKDVYAIIGHEAERVRAATAHTGVNFVLQAEQRGTGHALMVAREALAGYDHVIVLSGDAPLITPETITGDCGIFICRKERAMTLLSAELENPTGYGRVLRKSARSGGSESDCRREGREHRAEKDSRDQFRILCVFGEGSLRQHRKAFH